MMLLNRGAYTLIEIMVVLLMIGLLTAIAVPNFAKSRQKTREVICMNNLRLIEHAKEQWVVDNGKDTGDAVVDSEVNEYIRGGAPACPTSGTFTYGSVGTKPSCSVHGTR